MSVAALSPLFATATAANAVANATTRLLDETITDDATPSVGPTPMPPAYDEEDDADGDEAPTHSISDWLQRNLNRER